jgi:hypothetical protein
MALAHLPFGTWRGRAVNDRDADAEVALATVGAIAVVTADEWRPVGADAVETKIGVAVSVAHTSARNDAGAVAADLPFERAIGVGGADEWRNTTIRDASPSARAVRADGALEWLAGAEVASLARCALGVAVAVGERDAAEAVATFRDRTIRMRCAAQDRRAQIREAELADRTIGVGRAHVLGCASVEDHVAPLTAPAIGVVRARGRDTARAFASRAHSALGVDDTIAVEHAPRRLAFEAARAIGVARAFTDEDAAIGAALEARRARIA